MKILFSPSEAKYSGGTNKQIDENSFIFKDLFKYRLEIINKYQNFISKATNDELAKLFGTKKQNIIDYYKTDILTKPIKKAISRYDGVAFDYLEYNQLKSTEQNYIDNNVIIFSNLFGPILAKDNALPEYKLKQGEKLGSFCIEKFYNQHFSKTLDEYLQNEDILDLRAAFYEKFYKISKPYITMKFIKNGKVVSHFAKAYRGIILKNLAKNSIKTIDEVLKYKFDNLDIINIEKIKNKQLITYNIIK
jgi:uncharacterized protein